MAVPHGLQGPQQASRPAAALVVVCHDMVFRRQSQVGENFREAIHIRQLAGRRGGTSQQRCRREVQGAGNMALAIIVGTAHIDQQ